MFWHHTEMPFTASPVTFVRTFNNSPAGMTLAMGARVDGLAAPDVHRAARAEDLRLFERGTASFENQAREVSPEIRARLVRPDLAVHDHVPARERHLRIGISKAAPPLRNREPGARSPAVPAA